MQFKQVSAMLAEGNIPLYTRYAGVMHLFKQITDLASGSVEDRELELLKALKHQEEMGDAAQYTGYLDTIEPDVGVVKRWEAIAGMDKSTCMRNFIDNLRDVPHVIANSSELYHFLDGDLDLYGDPAFRELVDEFTEMETSLTENGEQRRMLNMPPKPPVIEDDFGLVNPDQAYDSEEDATNDGDGYVYIQDDSYYMGTPNDGIEPRGLEENATASRPSLRGS